MTTEVIITADFETWWDGLAVEENATMNRKFSDLTKKMSAKDRAEIKARSTKLLAELPLEQLRSARSLTQTNMAQILGVNQSAISKIEKRTDMYLSTLRSYVEAMGGSLEIQAVFPEGAVRVDILSGK
jgi:DNA-binding XRE family transcriptional regulator